jgi:hypothetical protein
MVRHSCTTRNTAIFHVARESAEVFRDIQVDKQLATVQESADEQLCRRCWEPTLSTAMRFHVYGFAQSEPKDLRYALENLRK